MKVYRMLHTPTGLFFTPSRGSGNLSSKGKLYAGRKPNLEWVGSSVRVVIKGYGKSTAARTLIEHFNIQPFEQRADGTIIYWIDKYFNTNKEDWQIVEVE